MSRIGKLPIAVPQDVQVGIEDDRVHVKGPKGNLEHRIPKGILVAVEEGQLRIRRENDQRQVRALHGLTRTLVSNLVTGVTQGFKKGLEIVGVGYRAEVQGGVLTLSLGYSHPVRYPVPEGIQVTVDRNVIITLRSTVTLIPSGTGYRTG